MGEGEGTDNRKSLNARTEVLQSAEIQSPVEGLIPVSSPAVDPVAIPLLEQPAMTIEKEDVAGVVPFNSSWNTRNLGLRIGIDAAAACSAAVLVAPIITAIDKGIIENASGRSPLGDSLRASAKEVFTKPLGFFGGRAFGLIFTLYFGTYFTANSIDTASSTIYNGPVSKTTAGTPKFIATSSTNLALCLYKDNRFTQMFGSASSTARPVPLPTFALFTVRDCLTIFASFNLPAVVGPHLEKKMSDEVKKYVGAASAAQFVTPAAVQLVSTPLHLLGLDLYNRQGVKWHDRAGKVSRDWMKSAFARMGRIIPAFGVGGVVNSKVRKNLMIQLD